MGCFSLVLFCFPIGELSLEGNLQLGFEYPHTPIDVFPLEVKGPLVTVLPVLTEVGQEAGTEAVECVLWSESQIWSLVLAAGLPVPSAAPLVFLTINQTFENQHRKASWARIEL